MTDSDFPTDYDDDYPLTEYETEELRKLWTLDDVDDYEDEYEWDGDE